MISALREYYETVMKPSWKWVRKHWKGYSVVLIISALGPYVWLYRSYIAEYIKSKFKKNEEES